MSNTQEHTFTPALIMDYAKVQRERDELLQACKLWQRAEIDGGVSMADFRNIASAAIRAAIAKAEGREP